MKRFDFKESLQNSRLQYMKDINDPPLQGKGKKNKNQNQIDDEIDENDSTLLCKTCSKATNTWYFVSAWVIFLIAFFVFILIWIIGHFTIQRLSSYYYFNSFNISPYTNIQFWKISQRATNSQYQTYFSSKSLYLNEQLKKSNSIALSLFFTWILWKFPLTVFTLKIARHKSHRRMRYSTYGFYIVLLLLIDIMVTAFQEQNYHQWVFFLIYVILSIVLIGINGIKNRKKLLLNLKNFIVPILYIVLAYVSFIFFIPALYGVIYKGLGQDAPYVIVHLFPFLDLIFYTLIIAMTYFCQPHTVKFIKMFYFLNTGYAIGHILLFSPDQVEFYYLVTYFGIRNFSSNWILQKVQKYVINPCTLPGWLMIYLVSLCINFIPLIGLGKLVVSKSFYSQILQLTLPILRYVNPNQFYAYKISALPALQILNPSLNSNIQISGLFITWVVLSITQKYHISQIQYKEIFFYIFGIYMFYFGLTTGIQLYYLQSNSF